MPSAPERRLQKLSEQLVVPPAPANPADVDTTIPKIRQVAPDSVGQRVKGKVVIVTGANSPLGIGRASAHQFAHNGALAIYICDFNASYLAIHAQELQSLYPSVAIHARQFDAADEEAMKAVVHEALETYGRLDIMFANAGIVGAHKLFGEIEPEEFMKTMRTNVLSVFLATKHASRGMLHTTPAKPSPSGSIIATASVAGLRSNAGSSDYSASKAAVISLMQTCAYQLSRSNIRCNAICPGLVETGMTSAVFKGARERGTEGRIGQLNPMGRAACADEVARVALFLASEESGYVNGQAWAVCGGLSAGHPYVGGKMA